MSTASEVTVEFRGIPGFPGYRVGDDGSAWSCRQLVALGRGRGTRSILGDTWKRLKPMPDQDGYLRVCLPTAGRFRPHGIHALVALAFIGPPPDGKPEVRHLDGNPTNNCLSNLAYGSQKENAADRSIHGRTVRGERQMQAKLTDHTASLIIDAILAGETRVSQAVAYGVSISTVSLLVRGRRWMHVRPEVVRPIQPLEVIDLQAAIRDANNGR